MPSYDVPRWRYYAIRILTGEPLHRDLPLLNAQVSVGLDGSSITGFMAPAVTAELVSGKHTDGLPKLLPWATWIVAENPARQIVAGGPLVRARRVGPAYHLEIGGPMAWLTRQYYIGPDYSKIETDPLTIVRDLVAAAQQGDDANVGIYVTGATRSTMRLGSPEHEEDDGNGGKRTVEAQPYALHADEAKNIGTEIGTLSDAEPGFDLLEEVDWVSRDDCTVFWSLRLGYPRIGARRTDVKLSTMWNLREAVTELADGDEYANTLVGRGPGQGTEAPYEVAIAPHDGIPRVMDVASLYAEQKATLAALTRGLATARSQMTGVSSLRVSEVLPRNLVGCDVYAEIQSEWGNFTGWHRITDMQWAPDEGEYTELTVAPAGRFVYGGPVD